MTHTAKEIRERSQSWLRFIKNHDRALLERKILKMKQKRIEVTE